MRRMPCEDTDAEREDGYGMTEAEAGAIALYYNCMV
jgi:hypothetical protein